MTRNVEVQVYLHAFFVGIDWYSYFDIHMFLPLLLA